MNVETRDLHRGEAGDVWRLVFDRVGGALHVEHDRPARPTYAPGEPVHRTQSLALGQFLSAAPAPVVAELLRLLDPIFPDPTPKPPGDARAGGDP